MSEEGCQYKFKFGANAGEKCGKSIHRDELCERCFISTTFLSELQSQSGEKGICGHEDPYDGEICQRVVAHQGYCLYCLSK